MLAVREAMLAFRRSPLLSALGITTIAFSLFAFGLFGLVALNIRDALAGVEERVEIRAFVTDGTPIEALATAVRDVQDFPEVERATIVSKEDALRKARRELGEFRDVFESDFLPPSIEVRLHDGRRDPETVRAVARRLQAYWFVDDVRYGQEWVEKLYHIRTVATVVGTVLGLAFAAVAVIIIGATIRMAVLARSREISIMQLVGATDAFIRRPFLIEGFVKGVAGGALALLLTWLACALISVYFIETSFFDARLSLVGLVAGALLGLVGSAISVGRHLRRI